MYARRPSPADGDGRVSRERRVPPCEGEAVKVIKKANKGARGMPVALGGDEGRDKLRKAAVRGKCPVTRGCPNGETRRERSRHPANAGSEPGELKHLSTRRKRK